MGAEATLNGANTNAESYKDKVDRTGWSTDAEIYAGHAIENIVNAYRSLGNALDPEDYPDPEKYLDIVVNFYKGQPLAWFIKNDGHSDELLSKLFLVYKDKNGRNK